MTWAAGQAFSTPYREKKDMTHRHIPLAAPVFSLWHIFGALFFGLLCLLLTLQIPAAEAAEVVDRIVVVVNDEIIVLQEIDTEVDKYFQSMKEQIETAGYSEEEKRLIRADLRTNIINTLINQMLVVQAAKEVEWLEVTDAEIDAQIQAIMEENDFTDEQFLESLENEGLTMEELRTQLKESSLSSSLVNYEVNSKIVVTKADVTQYYNQHPEKYQGKTTYHLRNIFIKVTTTDSAAAKDAAQNKLTQIFRELEAGESFESIARKYSEVTYASEGGELGNFELDDLSENLRAAIQPLSPGEYTPALETSGGYQILFVQEINKESDIPLQSVYSEIENELYQQQREEKRQAWIEGLRENAHIKILQ